MTADTTLHASCLLVGEVGVLIRGASGSGKSTLTRILLDRQAVTGGFGRLVADDRVRLCARHGRLVARPHPATAGLLEARGLGILRLPFEPAAVVGLVVDCDHAPERLPTAEARSTSLLGVRVPLMAIRGLLDPADLVLCRIRVPGDTVMTEL